MSLKLIKISLIFAKQPIFEFVVIQKVLTLLGRRCLGTGVILFSSSHFQSLVRPSKPADQDHHIHIMIIDNFLIPIRFSVISVWSKCDHLAKVGQLKSPSLRLVNHSKGGGFIIQHLSFHNRNIISRTTSTCTFCWQRQKSMIEKSTHTHIRTDKMCKNRSLGRVSSGQQCYGIGQKGS